MGGGFLTKGLRAINLTQKLGLRLTPRFYDGEGESSVLTKTVKGKIFEGGMLAISFNLFKYNVPKLELLMCPLSKPSNVCYPKLD